MDIMDTCLVVLYKRPLYPLSKGSHAGWLKKHHQASERLYISYFFFFSTTGCYMPRNALLAFLDERDDPISQPTPAQPRTTPHL